MNINDRAKKIVEERRNAFEIHNCINKILDVFEVSNDMEEKVWEVVLYTDQNQNTKRCCVSFSKSDQPNYYNSDHLLDSYNILGITQGLITSVKELDNLLTEEFALKVYEYWINHPLNGFEILNCDSKIRIIMNQNTICEKKNTIK